MHETTPKRNPMPTLPGMYWARRSGVKWWNYLLKVEGEAPMLFIAWGLKLDGLDGPKLVPLRAYDIEEWGPKLEEPENLQPVVLSEFEKRH